MKPHEGSCGVKVPYATLAPFKVSEEGDTR
jgi:hypothetical protein